MENKKEKRAENKQKKMLIMIVALCLCACVCLAELGVIIWQVVKRDTINEKTFDFQTPIVRIETEHHKSIVSKEEYISATITLTDFEGTVSLDNVSAGVRGRGNHSWNLDKKGYRIKFEKKQSMLSQYKCKSWALLPNYMDKTLLRNYYALSVASKMEGLDWTPTAKIVELYLNGEYLGVYLLCDQVQVDENRVNVEENSNDADTGFLVEKDHYTLKEDDKEEGRDYFVIDADTAALYNNTPEPIPYVTKSHDAPIREDFASEEEFNFANEVYLAQFNYIKNYMTEAFTAAVNGNYARFKELCDVNSFIDYFILDQVFANYEIDRFSSFYFHKNKGGKLKAGPVWDFDSSAGFVNPDPEFGFMLSNSWFQLLSRNGEFMKDYADRFATYVSMFKSEGEKLAFVALKNKNAISRNNAKWPIDKKIMPMNDYLASLSSYTEHLDFLIYYVAKRADFLNNFLQQYR